MVVASLLPWLISLWWIWRNTPCTFLFRLVYIESTMPSSLLFNSCILPLEEEEKKNTYQYGTYTRISNVSRGRSKSSRKKWKEHINIVTFLPSSGINIQQTDREWGIFTRWRPQLKAIGWPPRRWWQSYRDTKLLYTFPLYSCQFTLNHFV